MDLSQNPPTPYKVMSVTQVPRLDGTGRPVTYIKIHWTIPVLGYAGDLYLPESTSDPASVKEALEAEATRVRGIYALQG